MPNEQNTPQQQDALQIIAETAVELSQLFPTRDEVQAIAKDLIPAELVDLDSSTGTGGDVLCRGKAEVNTQPPTSYWGKAVMALKYAATYLTGRVEIKASTGIEITPVATPGSESLTFKNTGVTSINGSTGIVTLTAGAGITGTVSGGVITITNDGVRKLTAGAGVTLSPAGGTGEVTIDTAPAETLPTGWLVANLYFADAGAGDGSKNLIGDGVGTGANAGNSVTGYVIPGGPVGGSGGSGGSGFSGTQTTYGQAYISGTNLVQNVIVWTFSNGLLQSATPSGTITIATLLSCDT